MKLQELTENQSEDEKRYYESDVWRDNHAFDVIKDYTNDYHEDPDLDAAVDLMMKRKEFLYTGKMFRSLIHEREEFVKSPDLRAVLSKLQSFDQRDKRKYFSWSKTLKSMQTSIDNNHSHLIKGQWDDPVLVVYEQEGPALDVTPVLGRHINDEAEQELLARIHNNVHIVGFMYSYSSDDYYWKSVDNFKDLLDDLE